MIETTPRRAFGSGGSVVVERCQVCASPNLEPILFVGYLPPVNTMPAIGTRPAQQSAYPAQLLRCGRCDLAQLGLIVDPKILFPPDYPYTSGTTRILRENFAELCREVRELIGLSPDDLVVDIGSNDGTLLANFLQGGHRVLGIEPTDTANLAIERGVPTLLRFFDREVAATVRSTHGAAKVVTAANVFAHIEQVHDVVAAVREMLAPDGVFISESHYFLSLLDTLQYDTIYHEHLRYYSLRSLRHLLEMHGLEIFYAKRIPTHGGSIRVYAARAGTRPRDPVVDAMLEQEDETRMTERIARFREGVVHSKLQLYVLLAEIRERGGRVYGIGAPSRASTLISYVGLDETILDCVLEIKGSHKIGRYMPGTLIPVLEESRLFENEPTYALLLSWHIADELMEKLTRRGFPGDYIIPLPIPRVIHRQPQA